MRLLLYWTSVLSSASQYGLLDIMQAGGVVQCLRQGTRGSTVPCTLFGVFNEQTER